MQLPTTAQSIRKEKEIPFEIQTLQAFQDQNSIHRGIPHRHQHIEILWVKKGGGYLDIDLKRYRLGNNMLYCIVPSQLHQLETDETAEGYIVSFPEWALNTGNDEFELLYRSGLLHLFMQTPGIHMQQEMADELEDIIKKLYRETYNGYLLRTEIIKRYTSIFLIYLARQFEGSFRVSAQSSNVRLVRNFISLVEKKFMCWKLVKDYACELSVTPNYLNEIVKKISGYPAGHHIRQRVVLEARRQAACSDVSMKEIAYHLGFEDIAHFSKFFKSVYGKNFTDFKKESFFYVS